MIPGAESSEAGGLSAGGLSKFSIVIKIILYLF